MAKKIAINGFGRIGRLTMRRLLEMRGVEVVAINDLTDNETLAHLFKYDSAQGTFEGGVRATSKSIIIKGKSIKAYSERNPEDLPWADLGVDVVLECTGVFRTKEKAGLHLKAGAKKVIISAPAKSPDVPTIVIGVNEKSIKKSAKVLSNASCTTNCLATVAKVVLDNWGVKQGSLTTTHAYTADQRIQDAPHSDLRRARAAAYNIVPTSTGAASAVSKVLPKLKGKLFAMAIRVPVITGSLIELNVILEKSATVEQLNAAFAKAAKGKLKGILQYTEAPLVSSDIVKNPHSAIFDASLTQIEGKFAKFVAWYDNEAGYSARLADMTKLV
ncbi:MAG: type I glyceraldehyde-3-phosphate dehydrogenase [Bacteroidota bacterium]